MVDNDEVESVEESATARQRHDEAGLLLVGRGLLEGLIAGALLGVILLLLMGLLDVADNPADVFQGGALAVAIGSGAFAAMVGAPLGLAGGVLALGVLGLVARWQRDTWTTARAAWLAPALAVGVATTVAGVIDGWWWLLVAAPLATALTAWRVRRAVTRYATDSVVT